ncbi:MAG UNVERIFIED_CONTAM: hypothetical protein LVR18_31435 [Planctomycetaceae bacterium]
MSAEPQTLEQVGWRLGVTKERVRQIEVRTLENCAESQNACAC